MSDTGATPSVARSSCRIPRTYEDKYQVKSIPARKILDCAADGCVTCTAVIRALGDCSMTAQDNISVQIDPGGLVVKFGGGIAREIYVLEACAGHVPKSDVRPNLNLENADSKASIWLHECLSGHKRLCHNGVQEKYRLPTRLLKIGQSSGDNVALVEKKLLSEHYAALSYCWGGQLPSMTTRANITQHKEAMPWENLPKTFQDAISVARKLSIRYIWIDSLCIIQDDEEDWERESVTMANIYRNAAITLSAAAAKGPNEGLFPEVIEPEILDLVLGKDLNDAMPPIYLRPPTHQGSSELPLFSRGWVHQERLLSPRVLHFGARELRWECMQKQFCECGGTPGRMKAWPTGKP